MRSSTAGLLPFSERGLCSKKPRKTKLTRISYIVGFVLVGFWGERSFWGVGLVETGPPRNKNKKIE